MVRSPGILLLFFAIIALSEPGYSLTCNQLLGLLDNHSYTEGVKAQNLEIYFASNGVTGNQLTKLNLLIEHATSSERTRLEQIISQGGLKELCK